MKKVALSEVKDELSKYLRIAEKEEVVITRHSLENLRLEVGTQVSAQIKATALHVFPA